MLANFLIGLREGLEASLIVSILVAFLVKTRRTDRLALVWVGVAAALALSIAFAMVLQVVASASTFKTQETIGGVLSILSVGFVTWMIFWMKRTGRRLKGEIEGKLETALDLGAGAIIGLAFLAVGREGVETALFLWTNSQATSGSDPLVGAVLGLLCAVALGYLIYRGAVRINLSTFFRYTGIGLVIVAAGVLAYGFHDLQEAGWISGLDHTVFDISGTIPVSSWYGTLLKGAFNFNPTPTWVEFAAWLAYLVPVMTLLLWPSRKPAKATVAAPAKTEVA